MGMARLRGSPHFDFLCRGMLTRGKLPVRVAEANIGNLTTTVATNGKVEPQVNFEAHAPFAGVIRDLSVHEGQKVSSGKLLLTWTTPKPKLAWQRLLQRSAAQRPRTRRHSAAEPLRSASPFPATCATRILGRDQAQHDLDALRRLQATGAASASEVSAAEQRLTADNNSVQSLQIRQTGRYDSADLAHAQASLEDAQAAYAAAEDALHQAIVHAPFAGTVYSLPVSLTEYVQQGDGCSPWPISRSCRCAPISTSHGDRLAPGRPALNPIDLSPFG